MSVIAGTRLQALGLRYAPLRGESYGEAFDRAFRRYIKSNRESLLDVAVAVTSAHLMLDDGPDDVDPLLLKAVYDTNPSLKLNDIQFFGRDNDAIRGSINAAKGKYFEYLVVERLNNGDQVGPLLLQDGQRAVLAGSFNQPGWDVQIVDSNGAIIDYLQLKATNSVGYVQQALMRYPDIQILATHEVSDSHLVLDSGLSNRSLQEHVSEAVDAADVSIMELFTEYFNPLIPLVAIATFEGYRVVVGQQSIDAFKVALVRRGQRIVAAKLAGAAVYALGGGLLAIPAAFAAGLWSDRTTNQMGLLTSFRDHRRQLLSLRLLQQDRALAREMQ